MTLTCGRSGLFHAGVKLPAIPGTNMPESPVEVWGQEPIATEAVNRERERGVDFLRVRRREARCPATWKGESSSRAAVLPFSDQRGWAAANRRAQVWASACWALEGSGSPACTRGSEYHNQTHENMLPSAC